MIHKRMRSYNQTVSVRTEAFFSSAFSLDLRNQGQYEFFHWYCIFVKGIRAMQWSSRKYSVHVADYNTDTHTTLRRPPLFSTQDWCHPPVFPFALVIYTSLKNGKKNVEDLNETIRRIQNAKCHTYQSFISISLYNESKLDETSLHVSGISLFDYLIWIFRIKNRWLIGGVLLIYF